MGADSKLRVCDHCDQSIGICNPEKCSGCEVKKNCPDEAIITSTTCSFCEKRVLKAEEEGCSFEEIIYSQISNSLVALLLVANNSQKLLLEEAKIQSQKPSISISSSTMERDNQNAAREIEIKNCAAALETATQELRFKRQVAAQ